MGVVPQCPKVQLIGGEKLKMLLGLNIKYPDLCTKSTMWLCIPRAKETHQSTGRLQANEFHYSGQLNCTLCQFYISVFLVVVLWMHQ